MERCPCSRPPAPPRCRGRPIVVLASLKLLTCGIYDTTLSLATLKVNDCRISSTMARIGRPRGKTDTRNVILAAARRMFAAAGYDKPSVRDVAAAAAVDPAMIRHYFGSKA